MEPVRAARVEGGVVVNLEMVTDPGPDHVTLGPDDKPTIGLAYDPATGFEQPTQADVVLVKQAALDALGLTAKQLDTLTVDAKE